jgi:hypothetical protein
MVRRNSSSLGAEYRRRDLRDVSSSGCGFAGHHPLDENEHHATPPQTLETPPSV